MKSMFINCGSFLVLVFILHSSLANDVCKKLGASCSKNCKAVLICLEVDEEAFEQEDCGETFCEETENGATCTATTAQCSSTSANVVCGSEGRFPHPTETNALVKCTESMKPPKEICRCRGKEEINADDLTLPCEEPQAGSTREPVDCDTFVGDIGSGASPKFTYFCTESDEIIVNYKASSRRRRSLISTRASAPKCEPYSSGGDDGSGTEPPTTEPPTTQLPTTKPPDNNNNEPPTTQPPVDPPTEPPTTKPPTEPEIKCNKKNEYLPDPNECHHYYFCKDKDAQPLRRKCPNGTYFHRLRTCLEGTCPSS